MADLSVLTRLDRSELVELVSVLAHRLGDLSDATVAEARCHAATRRVEAAEAAVDAALTDYTRAKALHDRAIAEGRSSPLGAELGRLAVAYRAAHERSRKARAQLGRLRMETEA